ncbi:hypothetical protein O4J56_01650 [Nocardiopsis sp. RSe5-2]|uniref:Uncharacterized protein n=1 Tax=Nocardiopsis endophytica TaxID=3018445 RepID=A0ABT4TYL1_9ACTN|nr:hypothetical protein [Nocardiopsis endophytica]MDA2809330.1 hypothetical protein [Nocardiopsis endophytica]
MISYTPPPLDGARYARFVDLALRYTSWGIGYTSDGERLLFTAVHKLHDAQVSCHGLDTLEAVLAASDRHLRRTPAAGRVRRYYRRWERQQAERERRDLAALVDLAARLGGSLALATVAPTRAAA